MNKNVLRTNLSRLAVCTIIASGLLFACSDDDETPVTPSNDGGPKTDSSTNPYPDAATGADTSIPANDVSVALSVTYNGKQTGPLLASAWTTMTPGIGAPGGTGSNETAMWPGTNVVNLKNVKPGDYYIFTYIMVGADHRTGPKAGDPSGPPVKVTVTADGTTNATGMLFDPAPPDAGDGG